MYKCKELNKRKAKCYLIFVCLLSFLVGTSFYFLNSFAYAEKSTHIASDGAKMGVEIYKGEKLYKVFEETTFRTAEGSEAYCCDVGRIFVPGTFIARDPLNYMSQDTLNKLIFAKQELVFGSLKQADNYTTNYTIAQAIIWMILGIDNNAYPDYSYKVVGSNVDIPSIYSRFIQWYHAEGWKYRVIDATYWTNGNNQPVLTGTYALNIGNIEINKSSSNIDISNNNKMYSLGGAKYVLKQNGNIKYELTTNESGFALCEDIIAGEYELSEVLPPKGFALNTNISKVLINPCEVTQANVNIGISVLEDKPQYAKSEILLHKIDAQKTEFDLEKNIVQGKAVLEDAEFTINYYDDFLDEQVIKNGNILPKRSWIFKTNDQGIVYFDEDNYIGGDDLFKNSEGEPVIPLGTIAIAETKAPHGYCLNSQIFIIKIENNGSNAEVIESYIAPRVGDYVKRGDLEFVKCAEDTQERWASIPFKLTSNTTGESHILVSDYNGEVKTKAEWNLHTSNTNYNDRFLNDENIDESKLDFSCGIWFGLDNNDTILDADDNLGALPFDNYRLEELPVRQNKDYQLIKIENIVVERNNYSIDIGTLDNQPTTTEPLPYIVTNASEKDTDNKKVNSIGEKYIVDRVDYYNLNPNLQYKMVGCLMDKTTKLPLLKEDGQKYISQVLFYPEKNGRGVIDVEFCIQADNLADKTVVIFENLYEIKNEQKIDDIHVENDNNSQIELLNISNEEDDDNDGKYQEDDFNNQDWETPVASDENFEQSKQTIEFRGIGESYLEESKTMLAKTGDENSFAMCIILFLTLLLIIYSAFTSIFSNKGQK